MLPEGWRRVPLGECARFLSGNTPSKDREDYWDGDFPWVTAKDMKALPLTSSGLRLTTKGKEAAAIAPQGSVLVLTRGMTLLKDLPIGLAMRDVGFNQDVKALVAEPNVDPRYLAYQLLANKLEILDLVDTAGHGTGRLDTELLKAYEIAIPPKPEQVATAEIIQAWDSAIATTETLLANSRKQKQALLQQLLSGRKRLPGFSSKWRQYRLGKLFSERTEAGREDLPLLSITREEGVIHRDAVGRKDTSNEDKSKYLRICPGDIGYNTMRMWQGVSALSEHEGIVSPAYTVVIPSARIDGRYAAYLFKFAPTVFMFYRHSQGLVSDTWNLKYPHFAEIKVTIPDRSEQEAIVAVLATADEQIAVLTRKLEMLRDEKRALMQQLLTGKRRVRVPTAEATP